MAWVECLFEHESGFEPYAVSPDGASVGPAQFLRSGGIWDDETDYGRAGIPPDAVDVGIQVDEAVRLIADGFVGAWAGRC